MSIISEAVLPEDGSNDDEKWVAKNLWITTYSYTMTTAIGCTQGGKYILSRHSSAER